MKINQISCPRQEELQRADLIANEQRRRDVQKHGQRCQTCREELERVAKEGDEYP